MGSAPLSCPEGHFPLGSPIGNVNDNQLWGADWGILR